MNSSLALFNLSIDHNRDKEIISSITQIMNEYDISGKIYCNKYNMALKLPKNLPILPLYHFKYKTDNVFCWDLMSLELLINFSKHNKILFFMHHIPWLTMPNNQYSLWQNILLDTRVSFVSNQQNICDALNLCFCVKPKLFNNAKELGNVISQFIRQ